MSHCTPELGFQTLLERFFQKIFGFLQLLHMAKLPQGRRITIENFLLPWIVISKILAALAVQGRLV